MKTDFDQFLMYRQDPSRGTFYVTKIWQFRWSSKVIYFNWDTIRLFSVAEFIDLWLGDKVNFGIGLSYRPASHVAWRAGTIIYAGVDFIPQSGIYEFGYRKQLHYGTI